MDRMVKRTRGPATMLDRLFRPSQSSRPSGLGVGLYQCKRIIEAHGGTITLCSAERGFLASALAGRAGLWIGRTLMGDSGALLAVDVHDGIACSSGGGGDVAGAALSFTLLSEARPQ